MITIVLVIHLLLAIGLVGVILLQRSEGGALGGLGGGTFGGLMSARGSANLLTRTTAILATCFILTSVALALLAAHGRHARSIIDLPAPASSGAPAAPVPAGAPSAGGGSHPASPGGADGGAPAEPSPNEPAAPVAR